MKLFFLTVCVLFATTAFSQTNNGTQSHDSIYTYVEQMPGPGDELNTYLSKNLHYPDSARELGIEGKVFLKFVVNEDGSISNCAVLKGIGGGCDEEALRVSKSMPAWKPGMHDGKRVKVYATQPIQFRLQKEAAKAQAGSDDNTMVYVDVEEAPIAEYSVRGYFMSNLICGGDRGCTVTVRFIVNEDGHITNCRMVKGVDLGCDANTIKAVNDMPKWKPGKMGGKPVRSYYTMDINL